MSSLHAPIVMILIMVGLLPLALWIMYRAERVFWLRKQLIDLCADFNRRELGWLLMAPTTCYNVRAIYEYAQSQIPSYLRMLFSFRSLTLANWVPEHLLDLLQVKSNQSITRKS